MPLSLTLTTTFELPVVRSHAYGADTFCIHHCWGNRTSLGVVVRNVRGSRFSTRNETRPVGPGRRRMVCSFPLAREMCASRRVRSHCRKSTDPRKNQLIYP